MVDPRKEKKNLKENKSRNQSIQHKKQKDTWSPKRDLKGLKRQQRQLKEVKRPQNIPNYIDKKRPKNTNRPKKGVKP